jgi:hypothetical protein
VLFFSDFDKSFNISPIPPFTELGSSADWIVRSISLHPSSFQYTSGLKDVINASGMRKIVELPFLTDNSMEGTPLDSMNLMPLRPKLSWSDWREKAGGDWTGTAVVLVATVDEVARMSG